MSKVGIHATSPQTIMQVADEFMDRLQSRAIVDDDGYETLTLELGQAEVDVQYLWANGQILVQGCNINDEWVDADCFSTMVRAAWLKAIERSVGIE